MATQDAQVRIDFATQFDGRALYRAEKQFRTFQSTLKSVAKSLGVTLSVSAVVAYSKASVKAASEDAKAQRVLANQLANVGLSFEKIRVENFVSQMEKTTGILDSDLRPAFAQLLRVTGSVIKTQELLGVAFDAGAGSGVGFSKAINIISQAYVGNYKSVRQLNLGLTQQELKTISVTKLIDLMKTKFKNAGTESVNALDIINVGLKNTQEQLGFGLTDSFATARDKKNLDDINQAFENLQKTAYITGRVAGATLKLIGGLASLIGKLPTFNILGKDLKGFSTDFDKAQAKSAAELSKKQSQYDALRAKAEADALKRAKAIASQQKSSLLTQQKSLTLQKLSNLLKQAQKVFDNEAITLAAAAQGKLTDEERARLKLKQDIYDLEQAIASENVDAAIKISQTLLTDAEYLKQLRSGMESLKGVPDPFEVWLNTLREILATLAKLPTIATNPFGLGINAAGFATQFGQQIMPTLTPDRVSSIYNYPVGFNPYRVVAMADGGIVTSATPAIVGEAGAEAVIPLNKLGSFGGSNITVNVSGSVITEQNLIDAISRGLQNKGASGIPTSFSRNNSPYIA